MDSKLSKSRRIQVVYYLSRGGQLEHPHLLELAISSTEGLYLRDVKQTLTKIRGKGVAESFSWSYKRSYKNGYVWQDICDDDLIFPAHGCEYVLKGSEIFEFSPNISKTPAKFCASECKHELEFHKSCNTQGGTSVKPNISSKRRLLEKATEITDSDSVGDNVSEESLPTSHIGSDVALELNQSTNDVDAGIESEIADCSQTRTDPSQGYTDRERNCSAQTIQECVVSGKETSPTLADNASDAAATQTKECDLRQAHNSSSQDMSSIGSDCKVDHLKKRSELAKGEVSPPPSSSSSSSASTTADGSPVRKEKCGKTSLHTEKCGKTSASSENNGNLAQQTLAKRSLDGLSDCKASSQESPTRKSSKFYASRHNADLLEASSKHKHSSGGLGLLQFISCGGLDIKDEILPMSLYIETKGSRQSATDQVCELLRSGNCRPWYRLGRRGISKLKNGSEILPGAAASNNFVHQKDQKDAEVSSTREGTQGIASKSMHTEAVLPDVISLGRSSGSDHSNFSRELEKHREAGNFKGDSSLEGKSEEKADANVGTKQIERLAPRTPGDTSKCDFQAAPELTGRMSPRTNTSKCDFQAAPKLTGRISPRTPLKNEQNNLEYEFPIGTKPSEPADHDCRKGADNAERVYQSMALLWEKLLAPKKNLRNREEMLLPPQRSKEDWEKTLQNAVDLSLPPPDFHQLLQECMHCGRKFRPDSLKVHIRSCSTQKNWNNNGINSTSKNSYSFQRPSKSFSSRLKARPEVECCVTEKPWM